MNDLDRKLNAALRRRGLMSWDQTAAKARSQRSADSRRHHQECSACGASDHNASKCPHLGKGDE